MIFFLSRVRVAAFFLLLALGWDNLAQAESNFGFNYWPRDYGCNILTQANWTAPHKSLVQSELDQMASLGASVLRLMFWPQDSGYGLQPLAQGGGACWNNDFNEERANLIELLGFCRARGFKVIISFGNDYQSQGNGKPGHRWWMNAYGDSPQAFTRFVSDTRTWIRGFVDSIERSPLASTVLYYDFENEYCARNPYGGWYASYLYDCTGVPAGKRGYSVLRVPEDSIDLNARLGAGRPLNFVEFHSYPSLGANADVESCYDQVKAVFPGATVLLGEFGRTCTKPGEEAAQQTTTLDVATRARAKAIPIYLHWMLWDNAPPFPDQTAGWGYRTHSPKDVYGGMSALLNLCPNPDMERVTRGVPEGWSAGSSDDLHQFLAQGPSVSDAATNAHYARLRHQAGAATVWLRSPAMAIDGSGGNKKLWLNCYLRSNMRHLSMSVSEYDVSGRMIARTAAPAVNPGDGSWQNYLALTGPWSKTLQSDTHSVIVGIGGSATANPSFLDVDAVSVGSR